MPGKCSHSCPLAAFLLSLLLALLFMAASSSYPTRSSDRARNAATQISTTFRTSPVFLGSPTSFGNRHSVRGTVKKRKFALAVLGAVLFAVVAISTRAYCAPPDASRTQGRQIHFVPNSQEFW